MEKKNVVLLTVIAAATLLVAMVGATFAFFTATVKDERTGDGDAGKTNITAASVASTTVVGNVENAAGKFTATGVYPGHKEVAGLSVKVSNSGEEQSTDTDFEIIYNVETNGFQKDEIQVNVYRADKDLDLKDYFGCTHSDSVQEGNEVRFTETCTKSEAELEGLGATKLTAEPIKLTGDVQKDLVLVKDDIKDVGASHSVTKYYYVVVEFTDTKGDQNTSMNAELSGTISVRAA